jgi:hypothetical protein
MIADNGAWNFGEGASGWVGWRPWPLFFKPFVVTDITRHADRAGPFD